MPTPEEIENDRRVLTEVIRVKKENIEYWKSAGCGLEEETVKKSIEVAKGDLVKLQTRLDALPAPVKEVEAVEEIVPASTEEFEDPFTEK